MSGNGTQMQIDVSAVITRVKTTQEARALPAGAIVGDMHGGVTFTDAVAHELEKRSHAGWRDIPASAGRWTVIILNR